MKLYVDDIRNAPDQSWSIARSVDSAINCIATFGDSITHIALDHDISHQVVMGERSSPYPCVETFTAVARYMAEYYRGCPSSQKPKVTIHTSNPMGAKNMQFILQDFPDVTYTPAGIANRLETEV